MLCDASPAAIPRLSEGPGRIRASARAASGADDPPKPVRDQYREVPEGLPRSPNEDAQPNAELGLDTRGAVARGQLGGLAGVRCRGFADPRSGGPRHLLEPPVGIACGDPGDLHENDRVPPCGVHQPRGWECRPRRWTLVADVGFRDHRRPGPLGAVFVGEDHAAVDIGKRALAPPVGIAGEASRALRTPPVLRDHERGPCARGH
jgi:hypothetical protein